MKKKLFFTFFSILMVGNLNASFILITTLYNEKKDDRVNEYITCLERNLTNAEIDQIHIFYDTSKDDNDCTLLKYLKSKKVHLINIKGRISYGMCFTYANEFFSGKNVIIANGDIFFNETLGLLKDYDLRDAFMALTRWNVLNNGALELFRQFRNGQFCKFDSESSQDAWIFKAPIRQFANDSIVMGLMWCDSAIAYQAKIAGMQVINPCYSLQACHLHLSDIRNYDLKERPYAKEGRIPVEWSYL